MNGDVELASFLLSHRMEILKLLIEYGGREVTVESGALIAAAEVENLEALELLCEQGAGLEEVVCWWCTAEVEPCGSRGAALYRACRTRKGRSVEVLLGKGADPNSKDMEGVSCLAISKEREFEEIVRMLEEKGATE
jgi:ankyrin repeat protein